MSLFDFHKSEADVNMVLKVHESIKKATGGGDVSSLGSNDSGELKLINQLIIATK